MLNAITWLWLWLTSSDGTTATSDMDGTDMMEHGTDPQPPWPPR